MAEPDMAEVDQEEDQGGEAGQRHFVRHSHRTETTMGLLVDPCQHTWHSAACGAWQADYSYV